MDESLGPVLVSSERYNTKTAGTKSLFLNKNTPQINAQKTVRLK